MADDDQGFKAAIQVIRRVMTEEIEAQRKHMLETSMAAPHFETQKLKENLKTTARGQLESAEIKEVKQTGTIQEYIKEFEDFIDSTLPESHHICSFLSGLKHEIRHSIRMFRPLNLYQAYTLARLQEPSYESNSKLHLYTPLITTTSNANSPTHLMKPILHAHIEPQQPNNDVVQDQKPIYPSSEPPLTPTMTTFLATTTIEDDTMPYNTKETNATLFVSPLLTYNTSSNPYTQNLQEVYQINNPLHHHPTSYPHNTLSLSINAPRTHVILLQNIIQPAHYHQFSKPHTNTTQHNQLPICDLRPTPKTQVPRHIMMLPENPIQSPLFHSQPYHNFQLSLTPRLKNMNTWCHIMLDPIPRCKQKALKLEGNFVFDLLKLNTLNYAIMNAMGRLDKLGFLIVDKAGACLGKSMSLSYEGEVPSGGVVAHGNRDVGQVNMQVQSLSCIFAIGKQCFGGVKSETQRSSSPTKHGAVQPWKENLGTSMKKKLGMDYVNKKRIIPKRPTSVNITPVRELNKFSMVSRKSENPSIEGSSSKTLTDHTTSRKLPFASNVNNKSSAFMYDAFNRGINNQFKDSSFAFKPVAESDSTALTIGCKMTAPTFSQNTFSETSIHAKSSLQPHNGAPAQVQSQGSILNFRVDLSRVTIENESYNDTLLTDQGISSNTWSSQDYLYIFGHPFYITFGLLQYATRTLERINSLSTFAWNLTLRGYGCYSMGDKLVESFRNMVKVETLADGYIYSYDLSGCMRPGLLRDGKQVHARLLRNGYGFQVYIGTHLADFDGVCGRKSGLNCAHRVFDGMLVRDLRCWNMLLAGYVRSEEFNAARKVFDAIPERNTDSWTRLCSKGTRFTVPAIHMDKELEASEILNQNIMKRGNRVETVVLISWKNDHQSEATLKFLPDLRLRYANHPLWTRDFDEDGNEMGEITKPKVTSVYGEESRVRRGQKQSASPDLELMFVQFGEGDKSDYGGGLGCGPRDSPNDGL